MSRRQNILIGVIAVACGVALFFPTIRLGVWCGVDDMRNNAGRYGYVTAVSITEYLVYSAHGERITDPNGIACGPG